jgi:hypothetical protein
VVHRHDCSEIIGIAGCPYNVAVTELRREPEHPVEGLDLLGGGRVEAKTVHASMLGAPTRSR